MARPRTVSDETILDAAADVVARVGPHATTLEKVASVVGLTPAALVRRFGSRRAMLLALVDRAADTIEPRFAAARRAHASPLAALVHALASDAAHARSREGVSHGLAFLQIDLTDADFHERTQEMFRRMRACIVALLDEAVAARELRPTDTAALARAVEVVYNGSVISWAVRDEGSAEEALEEDLLALLAPHRKRARPKPSKPRRPRG